MNKIGSVISLAVAVLLGAGCATANKPDKAALQGSWSGREIGASPDTPRHFVFSGTHFNYRGSDPQDWGKGTFTLNENKNPKQLVITLVECGPKEYVGKTCCIIYKIEDGTLTATGNEPGNPVFPSSFDAQGARRMVFKKE